MKTTITRYALWIIYRTSFCVHSMDGHRIFTQYGNLR